VAWEDFIAGANPVLAAAAGTASSHGSMVVLVIDDAGDDMLVAAISEATKADTFSVHDFVGEWDLFDDLRGHVARFTLRSPGAHEADRAWFVNDPPPKTRELLRRDHVVVLMPAKIAGDVSHGLDFTGIATRLRGSLVVRVAYGADERS
jgi:hypothetical protein